MTQHDDNEVTIEVISDANEIRRRAQHRIELPWITQDRADDLRWLNAVCSGLRHRPYLILATRHGSVEGILPLAFVKSLVFGKFLVSLPYVNTAGTLASVPEISCPLISEAVRIADQLGVRHLELRHEQPVDHAQLTDKMSSKVHMRLELPGTGDELWQGFKSKVRNKVKKGDRHEFSVQWGSQELIPDFHVVFSHTMRDLGTPVFGKQLFQSIIDAFDEAAEICIVRDGTRPVAVALLIHGAESTMVPSAASLHSMNSTNVNDWMYWQLLKRAIERGQKRFDFGRCTPEGNTYAFKKKWGAEPEPAVWQYYVREGSVTDMRPEGGKYDRAVKLWQKLPVQLTRVIGPPIVRGIP